MTTPKVQTIKRQDSRFYVSPDDTALKVPGVTSVLNMYPKPFLQFWAAKKSAEYAVDNLGALVGLTLGGDRDGAIDLVKGAARRDTAQAAAAGDAAHSAFERMAKGLDPGRITPEIRPFVDHFARFLDEKQPEYIYLEETVWSDEHLYAGSFDAYFIMDGVRYWVDNKTTRSGVHEEVGLQLAAYRYSDAIIRSDGSRVPTPEGDAALVVHVRPEGLKLVPVRADEFMFERFLELRSIFDYEKNHKSSVVGDVTYSTYPDDDEPTGPKRRTPRARRTAAAA